MTKRTLIIHGLCCAVLCAACNRDDTQPSPTAVPKQDSSSAESTALQQPPKDPVLALGTQFLQSLQKDDLDQFHQCWIQVPDLEAYINDPPPGVRVPSSEQFQDLREELLQRDQGLAILFPILRRALQAECGDLSNMALVELIVETPSEKDGQRMARGFTVVLTTADKRQVRYGVETGVMVHGRWYFVDRPDARFTINTEEGGDAQTVQLEDHATPDEGDRLREVF